MDAFPARVFTARVESVRNAPREVQGVVSYEATLSVDNREGLLRPGMTATAEIVVDERRDVLLVPNAALRFVPPEGSMRSSREGAICGSTSASSSRSWARAGPASRPA